MRLATFVSIVVVLAVSGMAMAETVSVVTKENAVRESCRFLAPVRTKVAYGDPLEVTGREGDWIKVKFLSHSGCIHKIAVTDRATWR